MGLTLKRAKEWIKQARYPSEIWYCHSAMNVFGVLYFPFQHSPSELASALERPQPSLPHTTLSYPLQIISSPTFNQSLAQAHRF